MKVKVTQSCLTLCDPMDCSLLGSSVHGILQARMLEWVAMPFSRESSQPRGWTLVSYIECRFLTVWATRYLGACPIQTKFSAWQSYHTLCAWVSWDLFYGCRCPAETSSSTQSPGAGEFFLTILLFRERFFLISPFHLWIVLRVVLFFLSLSFFFFNGVMQVPLVWLLTLHVHYVLSLCSYCILFLKFIFDWIIIALQYYIGFFHNSIVNQP